MWQFFLIFGHLTDVVQQTGTLGGFHVEAKFGSHGGAELSRLDGVLQQVLTIAGTVFHATDHLNQFGIEVVDTKVDGGALTDFHNLLIHLLFHFMHYLFDTGGMDTTVDDELLQGKACDFAANRVEARDEDGVWAIVDDDFDTSHGFKRADVAAFTTDDATLNLIIFNVEHADRVFDGRF